MPGKWHCPAYLGTYNLLLIPSCSMGQGHRAATQGSCGAHLGRAGAGLAPEHWGQALQAWTDAVCVHRCSLHVLYLCCLCFPTPRATCLGSSRANEHPWVGGSGWGSWLLLHCSSLTPRRASLLLIPSISPQYQQSPPGRAIGRRAAAGSWQAVRSGRTSLCIRAPDSPSRRCGWAVCS